MISFRQLFANPFQAQSISDDALRIFTHDHLQKLAAANTSEEFNARLTDTVAGYSAFGGVIVGTDLNRRLQIVATSEMLRRWNAFREWMTEKAEPHLRAKTGRESVLYARFLPEGMEELQQATLPHAGQVLERIMGQVTGPQSPMGDVLGADFVTTLAQHRRQFIVARHAQLALRGEFLVGVLDRDIARGALEIQLFDNALALMQRHPKHPIKAMQYFHLELLEYEAPAPPIAWPGGAAART